MSPEELEDIRSTLEFAATNGADEEFLDTAYNLIAHIDSQAAQIEALKEMLVSMTTTAIWKASYDSLTGKYTISDADAEKMARQQLKADPDL